MILRTLMLSALIFPAWSGEVGLDELRAAVEAEDWALGAQVLKQLKSDQDGAQLAQLLSDIGELALLLGKDGIVSADEADLVASMVDGFANEAVIGAVESRAAAKGLADLSIVRLNGTQWLIAIAPEDRLPLRTTTVIEQLQVLVLVNDKIESLEKRKQADPTIAVGPSGVVTVTKSDDGILAFALKKTRSEMVIMLKQILESEPNIRVPKTLLRMLRSAQLAEGLGLDK